MVGTQFRRWRPSLFATFVVTSAVLCALLGLVLSLVVDRQIAQRSLDRAVEQARVLAESGVANGLSGSAIVDGLTPEQRREINRTIASAAGAVDITRVVLYRPDGTIIYASDQPERIGDQVQSHHVEEAAAGEISAERITAGHFDLDPNGSLVEVYLPLTIDGESAVFELYVPFSRFQAEAADDKRELVLAIALGMAVLWLMLAGFVLRASRELERRAETNRRLALHDSLTGLGNRTLFSDRLDHALSRARRTGDRLAVVLLDLDRFKEINDTLGHHVGDRVLVDIADRLRGLVRESDTVARLGGDEFALLMEDTSEADARRAAARIEEVFARHFDVDGLALDVSTSIGIARFPDDGSTTEVLLQRADVAMYVAKRSQSTVEVYDRDRDEHSPDRLQLASDLAHAIDRGELVLHYQPKVSVETGAPTGVEALVRWEHPTRGLLAPMEFVPVAEQRGLIKPMTMAVLDLALAQAAVWWSQGRRLPVAVNLSPLSLLDLSLPDAVAEALRRAGTPAQALEIEITESSLVQDPQRAGQVMMRLAAMGIALAIDDFGTGYSSLSALRALPLDEIKIDRSFVTSMTERSEDRVIVESTIQLAKNLQLRVVAEGVEDEAVLTSLRALGCDVAQGFHMARPAPAAEVEEWLDQWPGWEHRAPLTTATS